MDWEVPEPENPWSNIGYWSDHQIIYLSRLMELLGLQHPDRLAEMARSEHFTHADVPYRLATYAELLADPNNSVTFEGDRHARAMARVAAVGGDGRLLTRADGSLATANLSEKLLILVIAKLVNFVPEGGIWMNTQRPEWNDANNALVGRGLSVVTVAHLHRFLGLMERIVEDLPLTLTEALASAIDSVTETLSEAERVLRASDDQLAAHLRRRVMDQLGDAGTAYRAASADGGTGRMVTIDRTQLRNLLSVSRRWMARTVRLNRRHDGLYHSYNTLVLGDGTARIDHLDEMLEGQVAVLDSGVLDEVDVDSCSRRCRIAACIAQMCAPISSTPSHPSRPSWNATRFNGLTGPRTRFSAHSSSTTTEASSSSTTTVRPTSPPDCATRTTCAMP